MSDAFTPRPEHKFSFGLWTVCNRGRDPFGDVVRDVLSPCDAVRMLAEVGAWGVNLHDNDLVPIDATPSERDRIVRDFKQACERAGITVPMATVNLFYDPAFRDGALTANDPAVRAYALQKTMRAMDIGAELGAGIFVLWGGREGTETDACRRPDEADIRLLAQRGVTVVHNPESNLKVGAGVMPLPLMRRTIRRAIGWHRAGVARVRTRNPRSWFPAQTRGDSFCRR